MRQRLENPIIANPFVEHSGNIEIAASETTDGMDISIQIKGGMGKVVFDLWFSEVATGLGLTDDTYSGTLTASTGFILATPTEKKHFRCVTDATGLFEGTLVDSNNPTDQYPVMHDPVSGRVLVGPISGTNWEGA